MLTDKKDAIEVFLGLLGMFLVFTFLAWIGIWMVLIALFYHWRRIRREAQKEGKEVIF